MDIAALIGIFTGISLVISAILMEGQLSSYINVPGMMIVLGGTLSATLLNFRMNDVVLAFSLVLRVFTTQREAPPQPWSALCNRTIYCVREGR